MVKKHCCLLTCLWANRRLTGPAALWRVCPQSSVCCQSCCAHQASGLHSGVLACPTGTHCSSAEQHRQRQVKVLPGLGCSGGHFMHMAQHHWCLLGMCLLETLTENQRTGRYRRVHRVAQPCLYAQAQAPVVGMCILEAHTHLKKCWPSMISSGVSGSSAAMNTKTLIRNVLRGVPGSCRCAK